MVRILHSADLHLSARQPEDRAYSLDVFAELCEQAVVLEADCLLICGDFFDTFADAEALRADVRRLLEPLACEVLYIPGNHEEIQRGKKRLDQLDFGRLELLHQTPFAFLKRRYGPPEEPELQLDLEFLAIPHQSSYGDARNWEIPPREAPLRIALAHGVAAGLSYTGPDEEGGSSALDPSLFQAHQVDYAALGHIHRRRLQRLGDCLFSYPGSARIWRRGEEGPRGFVLLEVDRRTRRYEPRFVPLERAGQYRYLDLPLGLDGQTPDLAHAAEQWSQYDWIELRLSGLVEDETRVAEIEAELRKLYGPRVRRLEIQRDDVAVLPGVSAEPVARKFLQLWSARDPDALQAEELLQSEDDREAQRALQRRREVWRRARELGLREVQRALNLRR